MVLNSLNPPIKKLGSRPALPLLHPGSGLYGGTAGSRGVSSTVAVVEVGIKELQRETSRLIERVEDGQAAIVTRYGRPVALLLPATFAAAWVQAHRPLDRQNPLEDASGWPVEDGVRIAPGAEDDVGPPWGGSVRARLLKRARVMRSFDAVGRVAIRVGLGQHWALIELNGAAEPPTLLEVSARRALERYPM